MDGAFGAKRPRRRPLINITSLLDVMFLLVIFFAVSSQFRSQTGLDIVLPAAASASEQPAAPHEIQVAEDGTVSFQDAIVSTGQLKTALQRLIEEEPDALIVLRSDEKADWQDVVNVIDVARQVGGQRLIIPTRTPDVSASAPGIPGLS